jgi:hypothetical protein
METMDIVNRYVSVWNEADADERRRRIRSLWAPDGTSCFRLFDSCGYEAIEARVAGSWDKWLRDGKFIFRPNPDVVCHHDVVKVKWEMVTVPDGKLEATGLSFLVLNSREQVQHDYQFNPTATEAEEFVERYLAVWNESNGETRRRRITELWAPDGRYFREDSVRAGHRGIEEEAAEVYGVRAAKGYVFSSGNSSHGHHNLVRLTWHVRSTHGGDVVAAGSDLLVLDETGRIRADYRFDEPRTTEREGP